MMLKRSIGLALFPAALAGCSLQGGIATPQAAWSSLAASPDLGREHWPVDVASFIARRESCDHFRGEMASDAERAAFLDKAMRRDCSGTDRRLAELRARYSKDARISARLAEYEEQVE